MNLPEDVIKLLEVLKIKKHPRSICIANYKGGVGKTTATTLIGYFLAHHKYRVLMIDIDPQCSLSLAVGFDPKSFEKSNNTIYHLVQPDKWFTAYKINFQNYVSDVPDIYAPQTLKIIKGAFNVDELDIEITRAVVANAGTDDTLFSYCKNMLNAFSDFDYILIDCPPNKMYLTQAMLRASSYYLAITIPDKISVYGMPRLLRWVKEIPKNEKPKLLGCILNTVNRSGGNEFGTVNQQNAENELVRSIKNDLDSLEISVINSAPILAHIPRLDAVSRFLSQGAQKIAWFDLKNTYSDQKSISEIMLQLLKRIEHRIDEYAKI